MAMTVPTPISAASQPRSSSVMAVCRKKPKKSPMNSGIAVMNPRGPKRRQYVPRARRTAKETRAGTR